MFYKEQYYVPDFAPLFVGSTHGWDASDPRYRWRGEPYGNWATPIYQDPITQATLYLASAHVAFKDPSYIACLGVRTIINVAAKKWYEEDMMPYWRDADATGGPWRPYPNISIHVYHFHRSEILEGSEELLDMRMTEQQWPEYFGNIENWLDEQLGSGNSTLVHDLDGCRGSVAASVAYIMRKTNESFAPIFEEVLAKRPCAKALTLREHPNKWHYKMMQEIGSGGPIEAVSAVVGARRRTPSQYQHVQRAQALNPAGFYQQ